MRLYIQAVREGGQVGICDLFRRFSIFWINIITICLNQIVVRTRMLEEGEEGLGSEENLPPIIIDAEVDIVESRDALNSGFTHNPAPLVCPVLLV